MVPVRVFEAVKAAPQAFYFVGVKTHVAACGGGELAEK